MGDPTSVQMLPLDAAMRLAAFARACKSAARTVGLYPPEHPSVAAALASVAAAARVATESGPLRVGVLPDTLVVDGRRAAQVDQALAELAAILHGHVVGHLTIHPGTGAEVWRRFLALVAVPADQMRARGGLKRVWMGEGEAGIELKEIDYSLLLRDRVRGDRATWDAVVANCLEGEAVEIDEATLDLMLSILDDPSRLTDLSHMLEKQTNDLRSPAVLASLLRAVAEFVGRTQPDRVEPVLSAMAEATGQLEPGLLLPIVGLRRSRERPELAGFVSNLTSRMNNSTVARLVARSLLEGEGATARLAEAFSALVPNASRRDTVLELAQQELTGSAKTHDPGFAELWQHARDLLVRYSDKAYVAEAYAGELTRAHDEAVELERLNPNPPERVAAWMDTVNDAAMRALDAHVVVDLLALEPDPIRRKDLADLAVARVNDLVIQGDFSSAGYVAQALVWRNSPGAGAQPDATAGEALAQLLGGSLMRHVATQLDSASDDAVADARRFCYTLGTGVIRPLAEVLAAEERPRTRQHLIDLLIGFGVDGRQAVVRLKQSPNPAVRRTAVYLLREFGGQDALPELESLLNDNEPHVQREATRAIAQVGSAAAYDVLTRALSTGSEQTRNVITGTIWTLKDDGAAPLLGHILSHVQPKGALRAVYERSLDRLGALGGDQAVDLLREALYRGEWWTPFRTSALRAGAATALARIGSDEAVQVLEEAYTQGTGSVRRAARAALARVLR